MMPRWDARQMEDTGYEDRPGRGRALNLDGGSSSAFCFERGRGQALVTLRSWKRVRNLLGIAPR